MTVRRTRSASSRAARIAARIATRIATAAVPLILLTSLTACEDEAVGTVAAGQSPRAGGATPSQAAGPSRAGDPSTGPSRVGEDTGDGPAVRPGARSTPAKAAVQALVGPLGREGATEDGRGPNKKVLEGGGFTTAVPGSDAPDRKVDVGPQYQVSEDLDIREVERLVKAVERIAQEQRVGQPMTTGGSVAAAVGTFSYRWFADGTVRPDPAWVAANIRTEPVPILGNVTGHRVLFPQLRGALREVVSRGLAPEIHPEEFGGCYVPRFIGRDPRKGLSLHTWGIAVDLNVPGNQRGVAGEIDRDVVAIFKKWGFAWGGDWAWTDPMHFELAQIVRPR